MGRNNIILLHGALGSKVQFDALKNLLSDRFNVSTMNFEGHGDRPSNEPYSMELFAQNVRAFLAEKEISKTAIFGYSMGGYVGLQVAKTYPDLVGQLMTLGTKFNWTEAVAAQETKMLNPAKFEEKVPAFAQRLATLHGANNWKEVVSKTVNMMTDLGGGKKLSNGDLKGINHDVLIGIGSLDKMVTLEESKQAAELLPNGKLRIMNDFKHPIEKVNMDELAAVIINFIGSD